MLEVRGLVAEVGFVPQGKSGMGMYSQFEKDRDQGNFDLLPELHAILSGMKVNSIFPWVVNFVRILKSLFMCTCTCVLCSLHIPHSLAGSGSCHLLSRFFLL